MALGVAGIVTTSIGQKMKKMMIELVNVNDYSPKEADSSNDAEDLTSKPSEQPAPPQHSKEKSDSSNKQPSLNPTANMMPQHSLNPHPLRSYIASMIDQRLSSGLNYINHLNFYKKGNLVAPGKAAVSESPAQSEKPDKSKDNQIF